MTLEQSVDEVIFRLLSNANLPKFQLERASEVFISVFLEEWLSKELKGNVSIVAQEFPLKKRGSNQSTNVDYLMSLKSKDEIILFFVELKTNRKIEESQLGIYKGCDSTWAQMYDNVNQIIRTTKKKSKYLFLLDKIEPYENYMGNLEMVFVTPHRQKPEVLEDLKWFSLQDMFESFTSKKHPELWCKVQRLSGVIQ